MITPRPYQDRLVDSCARAATKHSRILAVAPTASGKSIIIAMLTRRYLTKNPTHRVLVLCHQGEILDQNEGKLHALGIKNTGIYCASLGRKETSNQVVLASRDSLGRSPSVCGYFHCIIVDEAHLVADVEVSRYQTIFDALQPCYVFGLTGTPWRQDNGLIYGKGKYWQVIADRIGMEEVRDAGFLVPYTLPPRVHTLIDTSKVKVTAGDFNNKQLTAVSMTREVVDACLREWWTLASERKTTLFFCCSRDHADVVVRALVEYTASVAYLDGTTSKGKREMMLQHAKAGAFKAIVNVGVLTTGVDIPVIDCVCFLRATQSVSLFVQMAGRGLRLSQDKTDCLYVDCAGNFERFGSIERPRPPKGRRNENEDDAIAALLAAEGVEMIPGESPQKTCPACEDKCHAAATRCQTCGHVFFNHSDTAISAEDLAGAGILRLCSLRATETKTKKGLACIVIEYRTECGQDYKEWLFHRTPGYTKWQAEQKLSALERGATHIRVDKSKEFPRVFPLNLQSSGLFSPICMPKVSTVGDRITEVFTTPRAEPTETRMG